MGFLEDDIRTHWKLKKTFSILFFLKKTFFKICVFPTFCTSFFKDPKKGVLSKNTVSTGKWGSEIEFFGGTPPYRGSKTLKSVTFSLFSLFFHFFPNFWTMTLAVIGIRPFTLKSLISGLIWANFLVFPVFRRIQRVFPSFSSIIWVFFVFSDVSRRYFLVFPL